MANIAAYHRVSTDDQSIDRQRESTADYIQQRWDVSLGEIRFFRDKSTGTDTQRDGYRAMMADVEDGQLDAIVVHSISRISRSIRDLDRTVERIANAGAELHIISEGFEILPDESDPFQTAMLRLLGVFAELEAELAQQRAREGIAARQKTEEYHHGRAPFGFSKEDGRLVEAENYNNVCAVLDMVARENLSISAAANELGTSRTTIRRALNRGELYGISRSVE